ncbi:MAG TPA: SRPBCC domain-containing protein, partial [Thermoanaerobaculia bacterium]|nr:SRPBCC domain-containing protein [Thermoanaerobaculia bacterium]
EARTPRIVGEVMESVPPRRLVVSWAPPADAADRARHSRVAFDLEPVGDMVRLTVTHDELEAGSEMLRSISNGWPRVLSSLKSLLETGRPLNTWA